MLNELIALFEATPPEASREQYRLDICDHNLLNKPTTKSRSLTYRHLVDLYGLGPEVPLLRVLRRLWPLELRAQPLLALQMSLARDPLLISQITRSDGAAAGLDALEQRSFAAGVGIRQLKGKTKYQVELAYGQADSYERAAGNASNVQLEAFFGQVTVEHQWTPDLRFFASLNRHVSVDPVSAVSGQLITDAIAHLQYSITPNSYAALRLEYPYIEVFETDYTFTVPGASVRFGRRFGERFNVELHLEYDEQRNNAAAREAGFTEYAETAGKIVVNLFF